MLIRKSDLENLYITMNLPTKEVAKRLGVSVGSVVNYINIYGIPHHPHMTDEIKRKISLSNKGKLLGIKRAPFTDEHRRRISESRKGKYNKQSRFGGHKKIRSDGYVYIYCPSHPFATKDGYVMEHILVMEAHIGMYISRDYVVHHKNGKRNDNRIENLELMTFSEHASLHSRERWSKGGIKQYGKPVRNIETGIEYETIRSAAADVGAKPTNISRACKSTKRTVKGFHWEYII